MDQTIYKRQSKQKRILIEHLKNVPIVQIACQKTNVSRATYYRWRQEDQDFANEADRAIDKGDQLINDLSESQLIALIKDKHPTAIFYWLNHKHPGFTNKLEIATKLQSGGLTENQFDELINLLYDKNTFRKGQTLLTGYVFRGLISERMAQFILNVFMSQMRTEDVLNRKAESELMTEVMIRKGKAK